MADLNLSESEEMYLISLARLSERGLEGPVPVSVLADELSVLPISANQMVHKLEQEGVVDYLPYKGVALSEEGRRLANRTLRRRRLWELFLVEELGLGFAEADSLACRMEHIGSDEVTERLGEYLGNPQTGSQGQPIPPAIETPVEPAGPLSRVAAGHAYELAFIGEATLRQFLMSQSITEGSRIRVLATSSHGSVLIGIGDSRMEITAEAAAQVYVRRSILKENNAICATK